jgi:hypothetical protein
MIFGTVRHPRGFLGKVVACRIASQGLNLSATAIDRQRRKSIPLGNPGALLLHLHHIDRDAAGQIKTPASSSIHEKGTLRAALVNRGSITSSQLEGASTTRKVAEAMLRDKRQPRDRSETMIFMTRSGEAHTHLKGEKITCQGTSLRHTV